MYQRAKYEQKSIPKHKGFPYDYIGTKKHPKPTKLKLWCFQVYSSKREILTKIGRIQICHIQSLKVSDYNATVTPLGEKNEPNCFQLIPQAGHNNKDFCQSTYDFFTLLDKNCSAENFVPIRLLRSFSQRW